MGKIVIVDDIEESRILLSDLIKQNTEYKVLSVSSGMKLMAMLKMSGYDDIKVKENLMFMPDLFLLDVMMPEMTGFEVAEELRKNKDTKDIPIIFLTGSEDPSFVSQGFDTGCVDFIKKPLNAYELISRINVHINQKKAKDQLAEKNNFLSKKEFYMGGLIKKKNNMAKNINEAMINALEEINYYNDCDTGLHIRRVSEYSTELALAYGCDEDFVSQIRSYASLHDLGKIGIPDNILKKPGRYTKEEFKEMQQHVQIGVKMLSKMKIDDAAKNIVLYHHEKWDGSGYLSGLKGANIPLEARIIALADAYDALSSKRCYKESYMEDKVNDIILKDSGSHFDPMIVDAFFSIKDKILDIKENYRK